MPLFSMKCSVILAIRMCSDFGMKCFLKKTCISSMICLPSSYSVVLRCARVPGSRFLPGLEDLMGLGLGLNGLN